MPNWCAGTLRVRGTKENLTKFILEGLSPVTYLGQDADALDTEFAWGISAEELLNSCKQYNVDMRIHAFERGMCFNQIIEIIDGKITKDEEVEFDDYNWDCICPNIGG